jgi:hypothetical protein
LVNEDGRASGFHFLGRRGGDSYLILRVGDLRLKIAQQNQPGPGDQDGRKDGTG